MPKNLVHNPPWRETLVRHITKTPGMTLGLIYARMGFNQKMAENLRRHPDLRLSLAIRLARAAEMDPMEFVSRLTMAALSPHAPASPRRGANLKPARKTALGHTCFVCGTYHSARPEFKTLPSRPGEMLLRRASLSPKRLRDVKPHLRRRSGGA